jgi:hypothetical protein
VPRKDGASREQLPGAYAQGRYGFTLDDEAAICGHKRIALIIFASLWGDAAVI